MKLINPGHNACAGCGQLIAVRAALKALDKNTVIVNSTGCLEVTTTAYPMNSWGLPWVHSLFENSAPVASGVVAALKRKKASTKVVIFAGDGATFDIGLGHLSGMMERSDDILYICYDTEGYSNTGAQASGATPTGAMTTTTPHKNTKVKKDLLAIALGHKSSYVAQSTAGFPDDITNKVKKALTFSGSRYIQILSPCIPAWKSRTEDSIKLGKLAATTGLYPLLEYENGQLTKSSLKKGVKVIPIEQYLKPQGRFKNMSPEEINIMKELIADNIKKYAL